MKFGRKPRIFDPRVPHYSALKFMRATAPSIPTSCDWTALLPILCNLGMMLNDQLGDCTSAAAYHARQVWTANANPPIDTQPDTEVETFYEESCGYVPGDPSTDQGGVEQHVLSYWVQQGLPLTNGGSDKLLAFVEIDPQNIADVRTAIFECGVAYLGMTVPQYLVDGPPPDTWDTGPLSDEGHAVIAVGYDETAKTIKIVSWGRTYEMTEALFSEAVDEAYGLADQTWIEKTGATPLGLTAAQLQSQITAISEPLQSDAAA